MTGKEYAEQCPLQDAYERFGQDKTPVFCRPALRELLAADPIFAGFAAKDPTVHLALQNHQAGHCTLVAALASAIVSLLSRPVAMWGRSPLDEAVREAAERFVRKLPAGSMVTLPNGIEVEPGILEIDGAALTAEQKQAVLRGEPVALEVPKEMAEKIQRCLDEFGMSIAIPGKTLPPELAEVFAEDPEDHCCIDCGNEIESLIGQLIGRQRCLACTAKRDPGFTVKEHAVGPSSVTFNGEHLGTVAKAEVASNCSQTQNTDGCGLSPAHGPGVCDVCKREVLELAEAGYLSMKNGRQYKLTVKVCGGCYNTTEAYRVADNVINKWAGQEDGADCSQAVASQTDNGPVAASDPSAGICDRCKLWSTPRHYAVGEDAETLRLCAACKDALTWKPTTSE